MFLKCQKSVLLYSGVRDKFAGSSKLKAKGQSFHFISKTEYVLKFEAAFDLELNSLIVSNIDI